MTPVEKAEKIIAQDGDCTGVHCEDDECPCYASHACCDGFPEEYYKLRVKLCNEFLDNTRHGQLTQMKETADTLIGYGVASTKYNKPITGIDGVKTTVDVYRVLVAFNIVDPELQHSLKKLLNLGVRGKGDYTQDLDEAILSLQKMKERKEQECK